MMKRLLWLGVGLAVGALAVRMVTKKAQAYAPRRIAAGVRDSGRNALDSLRDFVDDVRDAMHEREQELEAVLADGRGLEELPAGSGPHPPDRPAEDPIR
jgi:hypothetical protein